jgi:hypothetical protein
VAEGDLPQLRASDADRERVAELLRHAAGDGQLTVHELDERLDQAYGARTRADLAPLTADLQVPHEAQAPAARSFSVRRGGGGARWVVAVMSGVDRKGRWRLAERCTALNLMGGCDLDLNDVELASDHVELTVVSIMGGADIRVPEGLNLEVSDVAVMGGNTVDVGPARPSPSGPVLHLRLVSLMGGTDVKRGRRLTREQEKARKAQERALRQQERPRRLWH